MIAALLARPWATRTAVLAATLAFAAALSGLRFDNTPETWLPAAGSEREVYERFLERFGDDSPIFVWSGDAALADPEWASDFHSLAEALRDVPHVSRVEAPASLRDAAGDASPSPLTQYLQSPDGRLAALAISPGIGLDAATRSRIVDDVELRLEPWQARVGPLRIVGTDVITHDLDLGSQRSLGGLSPLVLAIMCGIFWIATRSLRAVGAMLGVVVAASVWTLGAMALAGRTLNLVLVALPAILAVVTAAQAMHLLARYQANEGDATRAPGRVARWRAAVDGCWRPCLLSAVTTAAGFGSLAVSEISPIRDLGTFAALGVLVSFGLTFTLVPVLLVGGELARSRPTRWTLERARGYVGGVAGHAPAIVAGAIVVSLLCGVGLGRLALESHILRFFPEDHRIPQSYAAFEDGLLGLTPFEIELEGPRALVLSDETARGLDRMVTHALADEPLLRQALSPLVAGPGEPGTPSDRAAGLRAATGAGDLPESLRRFVFADGNRLIVRTTLTARTDSSNACDALARRLRARLEGSFPAGVDARLTGGATLLIQGQVLLLETQVRSFALAFAVVTLVIVAVFRRPSTVVLSLLPNLMPVAITLGLMGWIGVPLDSATVTVAGIAFGLIVDDTIHVLYAYRSARQTGDDRSAALAATLHAVGRPVLVTSLAVAAGFGAFAISPFHPTRWFGALLAFSALSALVCDLLVLPALLQLGRRGPRATAAVAALLALVAGFGCASAPPTSLPAVNASERVAIHGYDPVAYHTEERPVRGEPAHASEWGGARWHFASAANRARFEADPERYAPAYGGYCAYAVSVDRVADVDPMRWEIVDGRLYLNANRLASTLWKLGREGNIESADRHWRDWALGEKATGPP